MAETLTPDLCVIGAGSAGLSVAAGAVQMGASVVLIEKGKMGGDCLNYGCVPSKALLAAAHRMESIRTARGLGIAAEPALDFAAVHKHVHEVIAAIAPHDSVERFEGLGVTVISGAAKFTSPRTVEVAGEAAGRTIKPRRFVIATGSHAFVPPIAGLSDVPYLTNETVFDLTDLPRHLIVMGGGPIGCELAQAFRNLGSAVTMIEAAKILPKDDPDLAAVVRARLIGEGVTLHEGAQAMAVARDIAGNAGGVRIILQSGAAVTGSHLLVAVGRRPSIADLDLRAGGIESTAKGITVDAGLRTGNRRAYAIGDCAGGPQFTHTAGYHAGIVVRSALFRLPAKANHGIMPWVTYTDPELAQVGLTEAEARKHHGENTRVLTAAFADNDRARAERTTEGLIKVIVSKKGHILGAGIAGPRAGDLIQPWVLAMSNKLKIGSMATVIAPYPTLGEINKRAAGGYYTPTLYSPRTRALVGFLKRFG
ncbi:MAG: FAD-dependent oxidoreductase [Rhodospirillaceae bacterium]|nr:FAD-dependent oxidoreductase [Rhodospirillaceae bacterium]